MSAETNADKILFHWVDYLVLVLVLFLSAAIGVYYGWKDRKKKTAESYLIADGNMSPVPVGISLFVSFLSAIGLLADPLQVYTFGLVYWYLCVGYCLALPCAAHYIGVKYHRMKIISIHELIERRYSKYLMLFVSGVRFLVGLLFGGILLLAPCLALSQVSPLEVWMSVLIIGLVCTFYSTLGGMKAVLWADVLQCAVMLAGLLAVLIRATIVVGGFGRVWEIAEEGGRINLDKIDPNPLQHATVWTYLIGGLFRTLTAMATGPGNVQRYSSLPTERSVTISIYIALPLFLIFGTLVAATGLVMYAYYYDCDPLASEQISQSDQMLPLLTMEVLGFLPGVPGLFIACIFSACMRSWRYNTKRAALSLGVVSGSLSTNNSGMAAFALKDYVMPFYTWMTNRNLSPYAGNIWSKVLSLLIGLITIGVVFGLLQIVDIGLFQLTNLITGSFSSPVNGVFTIALVFPFIGDAAVICGLIVSTGVCLWIGIGAFLEPNSIGRLPTRTDGCPWLNTTNSSALFYYQSNEYVMDTEPYSADSSSFHISDLYKMSSLLLFALGPVLTTIVGLIITAFIYGFKKVLGKGSDKYSMELSRHMSTKPDDLQETKDSMTTFHNELNIYKSQDGI